MLNFERKDLTNNRRSKTLFLNLVMHFAHVDIFKTNVFTTELTETTKWLKTLSVCSMYSVDKQKNRRTRRSDGNSTRQAWSEVVPR